MGRYFSVDPVWLPDAPRIRALEGEEQLVKDWQPLRTMCLCVEVNDKRIALRDKESRRYLTELSIDRLLCGSVNALDISNDAESDDW